MLVNGEIAVEQGTKVSTVGIGERMEEWKAMETEVNLRRCWGVPMRRNSVFERFMERRLEEIDRIKSRRKSRET